MKIITGGQSGGDLSGNFFAKKNGIETEINAFEGFKPTYDELPKDIKINFVCNKENYLANLRCRTLYNVKNSDLTIILLNKPIEYTKGSKLTYRECVRLEKDVLFMYVGMNIGLAIGGYPDLDKGDMWYKPIYSLIDAKKIIKSKNLHILNIAGQRDLNRNDAIKFLENLLLDNQETLNGVKHS